MMSKHIGVQYIYEQSNSERCSIRVPENDTKILAALSVLPPLWVESLKQAVLRADLELIEPIVQKIQQYDPYLADTLQSYFDKFEYQTILTLLSQI
jgi:hypothetical protein